MEKKVLEFDNYWRWNIQTKECWFSDAWCKNLGFKPTEIKHHEDTWKSLVHKDCMPSVWKNLAPVIEGKKNSYECIYRLKNKNEKYIWHLDTGKVLERDNSGKAFLMEGYDVPIAC